MNSSALTTSCITVFASAMMALSAHAQNPSEKPAVSGKFLGNGNDGNIQHLLVQKAEPFSGKAAIQLIFTERDASVSKRPDWDATFKKFGSALVISTHKDGGVFGCEVAHSSHPKSPFSSVGRIKIKDMKVTDTHVSGTLTTGGEGDFFGQTWDVELSFSASLPKGAFADDSKPAPAPIVKKTTEEPAVVIGPKLSVAKLPLPDGALEVEYKKVVGHITFRSDSSVSKLSEDFSAKLKQQGWKDAPGSLMGKANAMLRRKLNDAELTIMVQPAGQGCTAKVFTQGLDWSEAPVSSETKPANADSIEVEANKLLNDALKNLPKF